MQSTLLCTFALLAVFAAGAAFGGSASSDNQIRQEIVRQSAAAYLATGHPCAFPYNSMRNGNLCGDRSAYIKPRGAHPLCYPSDVSDQMVSNWRRRHQIEGHPQP